MTRFGRYLREARSARDLTAEDLAVRCHELAPEVEGFHRCVIYWWERGRRTAEEPRGSSTPSLVQFDVVADVLGLSVEQRLHAIRLARDDARDRAGLDLEAGGAT